MKHNKTISKIEKIALIGSLAGGFAGAITLDKKGYRNTANVIVGAELLYCTYRMIKPIARKYLEEYIGVDGETPGC